MASPPGHRCVFLILSRLSWRWYTFVLGILPPGISMRKLVTLAIACRERTVADMEVAKNPRGTFLFMCRVFVCIGTEASWGSEI